MDSDDDFSLSGLTQVPSQNADFDLGYDFEEADELLPSIESSPADVELSQLLEESRNVLDDGRKPYQPIIEDISSDEEIDVL